MKRIIATILATAGILGTAAPALAHTARPIGTVYLRNAPSTDAGVIAALPEDQSATVLSHEGQWLKVRTAGGMEGYMADWVTRMLFDDETAYVTVDTDVLNVRSQPGLDGAVLGQVSQGGRYHVLEGLGGWYKVEVPGIGAGWVTGDFISMAGSDPITAPVTPPPATQPPSTPPPDQPVEQAPRQGLAKQATPVVTTYMYTGRGKDYDRVAAIKPGQVLTYQDSMEGWIKVGDVAGNAGWVEGSKLSLSDRNIDFAHRAAYGVQENDWRMQFMRIREVVPGGTGLMLRTGPSATASGIGGLSQGDRMRLLYIDSGEYVKVELANGTQGWVSRNWLKPVAGLVLPTESVRLQQVAPGFLRLELTGQAAQAEVKSWGNFLQLSLADNPTRLAGLVVQEYGAVEMTMDRNSLTAHFTTPVQYRVVEQTADRTVVEIRPVVTGVEAIAGASGQTYRIHIDGQTAPAARRDADSVVLNLPGALLQSGAAVPAGISLPQGATGLTARVVSGRSFALKRGDGYVDLVLFQSGLAGKTIVVDAGHGGTEAGARGPGGLQEEDFNLAVALKLQDWLQKAGAKVIMTRTGDTRCASPAELAQVPWAQQLRYDLNCRAETANRNAADLFVSIHANANPSSAMHGTTTYFASENFNAGQSKALAGYVQQQLVQYLGTLNVGVKDEDFYVVKYTDAPAILVETGFLTNLQEESWMKTDGFKAKAAEAIFRGITQFFK
jgi:N-acetylmuramoyl-L-alanine amidase